MKQTYTSPAIHIVQVGMDESIAQFVVTSKSVPENSGDAKGSDFFDEENEEEQFEERPWGNVRH